MTPGPTPARDRERLRTGRAEPSPAQGRRTLRAGPVVCELDGPDVRAVRWGGRGGRELAQRIYVAVRDEGWGTVPGELTDLHVEQAEDSFVAGFRSRHREGAIDFTWEASIVGMSDGTIRCRMAGVAATAFRYAKIGFNVHHPLLESTGRRYRAIAEDGSVLEGTLEPQIEPQRVVDGRLTAMFEPYRSLAIDYLDGAETLFAFAGDLFELQDHRNWADGNFKSYGTPLAVPWPMDAVPGLRIEQEIVLSSSGLTAAPTAERSIEISVGEALGPLPPLGLARPPGTPPLGSREVELLGPAQPAHLRIALDLGDAGWRRELASGAADCRALDAAAELAISSSTADEGELERLAAELRSLEAIGVPVARVLVLERQLAFAPVAPITTAATVARVRAAASLPGIPFAGGSDQFFSDVNRNPPAAEGLDAVCFGLCPQVHAADDASLMENLAALPDAVRTARLLLPELDVVVSPVTLAARFGPYPGGAAADGGPPGSVDVRLHALFGASWTLGAVAWLAGAEPAAITFFDTAGPAGVIAGEAPPPYAAQLPHRPGEVHPVLHVLADIADAPPGAVRLATRSSAPLVVGALALRGEAGDLVLIANHSPEPRAVVVSGLAPSVVVRVLDEESAERAMVDAPAFRGDGERRDAPGGELALTLGPYASARIGVA